MNPTQSCNCDANENKWLSDEGTLTDPRSLGITEMFFLQQKDLTEEAQGRITLGPLECVETSKYRVLIPLLEFTYFFVFWNFSLQLCEISQDCKTGLR